MSRIDDQRLGNLRSALETASEKLEALSADVADGLSTLSTAIRLKTIDDLCRAALAEDEHLGGKTKG